MMSKTHITVGVATSLAVCRPTSIAGIFASVIGGSFGGIICDIECKSTPGMRDALIGRIISLGITATLLFADRILNTGLWSGIISRDKIFLCVGIIMIIVTCFIGRLSEHRTFTHSLVYVALVTFGVFCISPELAIPTLAGCLSHLSIDTLNKKPIPWLYPLDKKGICFNLCYASKTGNAVLMWSGLISSIALLSWRIMIINGIM